MTNDSSYLDVYKLPQLSLVFDELRKGRHISTEDGNLYGPLCQHYNAFKALFENLGFTLIRHSRDFFYFESDSSFRDMPTKIAVFMFILIEDLASKGQSIEEALLSDWISVEDLPHDKTARYKRYMDDAGINIERSLSTLNRLGFADYRGGPKIRFKTPVYRFIDLCLIVLNQNNSEDKTKGESYG